VATNSPILVDSNVILDSIYPDLPWFEWSSNALASAARRSILVINPLILAEVSVSFDSVEAVEHAVPMEFYRRDELPYAAAFLAGKAFLQYRRSGGERRSPLPDFYIGAHAAIAGFALLTRDARRFRTYFPTVELIAPDSSS
jgi:predicted nucleic acid-binding protein